MMKKTFKQDQVYALLRERIATGVLRPGERLPAEPELARVFGVARDTLRCALRKLERESFVVRTPSKGTFVRNVGNPTSRPKVLFISSASGSRPCEEDVEFLLPAIGKRCEELNLECVSVTPPLFPEMKLDSGWVGIIYRANLFLGTEPILRQLRASNLPVVLSCCFPGDPEITGFSAVLPDFRQAYLDGIEHLRRHGHRRIGLLLQHDWESVRNRMDLSAADLNWPEELLCFLEENGTADSVKYFLSLPEPPTALFCYSDYYAVESCRVLREMNIDVPGRMAVLGYGGTSCTKYLLQPISTVDFNWPGIGTASVDLLLRLRERPGRQIVRYPHELSFRQSSDYFLFSDQQQKKTRSQKE